jgi:hypothetical protein
MYELVTKHFDNREDAQFLVEGIEDVIAVKFDAELDKLATKEDLRETEFDLRKDMFNIKEELSTRISSLEIRMEQGFKNQLQWMIGTMFVFATLIITLVKLL